MAMVEATVVIAVMVCGDQKFVVCAVKKRTTTRRPSAGGSSRTLRSDSVSDRRRMLGRIGGAAEAGVGAALTLRNLHARREAQAHQGDGPPSPLRRRRSPASGERATAAPRGWLRASPRPNRIGRWSGKARELAPALCAVDQRRPNAAARAGSQGRAEL